MNDDWTHPIITNKPTHYWGYHGLFNLSNCNKSKIADETNHRAFLIELVEKIKMVAYGEPVMAHFATHDPSKGGWTILQMISTSSITGHFVDATGEAYLDIFSCLQFELEEAEKVIRHFYMPTSMQSKMELRKAY